MIIKLLLIYDILQKIRIGVEKYKETFNESVESYFRPLTLERLVGVVKKYCTDNWINEFENRYLNFDKIIKASL